MTNKKIYKRMRKLKMLAGDKYPRRRRVAEKCLRRAGKPNIYGYKECLKAALR